MTMLKITQAFVLAMALAAVPVVGALAQGGGSGGSGGGESLVPPSTTSGPGGRLSSTMPEGDRTGVGSAYSGATSNATQPGRPTPAETRAGSTEPRLEKNR